MKFPLSWLKEYIDINYPPVQIAKLLTQAGIEVDGIESTGSTFSKVVVCRVLETSKHPNAERLCVARVTDGEKEYQVVCGASNCRAGLKTALAVVGAQLQDETGNVFEIKATKLRGVESFGMLCSGQELHLADESDGIIEFAEQVQEGASVAEMFADTVFEVSLTPNLGHCSSLIGIARELSAMTGIPVRMPAIAISEDDSLPIEKLASVKVEDAQGCPRYACRLVKNVQLAPSPDWMQKRLLASGIRAINNIVDITNYVLLELGHPLHAFDYDRLEGHAIHVRRAKAGEEIVTLDDKARRLSPQDLLICDGAKPIALAGIMGGLNTEVNDSTKHVLIESAYFDPVSVRKSSKHLGLQTDSSKRFERGTDPNNIVRALDRAAMLMQKLAGGQIAARVIDEKGKDFLPKIIVCRLSKTNGLLGTHLSVSEVETIWQRLGFTSVWDGQDSFSVTVPTYRNDIVNEVDLIEEVARIYGYDNFTRQPSRYQSSPLVDAPLFMMERELRARMLNLGLQEFVTCNLIGPSALNPLPEAVQHEEMMIRILNATSVEQSLLRTSLLPGMLQVIKHNVDHQNHDISGFEIGRVHFKNGDQFVEQTVAGVILSGKPVERQWDGESSEMDFYDLKGIVESLLTSYGIDTFAFKANHLPYFHSGRQASIYVDNLEIGSLGEVHPSIVRKLDVPQRILFAELNVVEMCRLAKPEHKMKEIPIYPGSGRDWTVTLPERLPIQDVFDLVAQMRSSLLEKVSLLDLYRNPERLGEGVKNATFHFLYRDREKTVEQETVENEHKRIIDGVTNILEKK